MKTFIIIVLFLISAIVPTFAQGKLTGRPIEDIRNAVEGTQTTTSSKASPDLISKIQQVALADLQAASADAKATGDNIAAPCYDAWIALITAQQAASAGSMPEPHVITSFQRNRDLINALRPGSPMKVACAPLAEELKQDVLTLLSKIAGGALALPAMLLPFGL